MADQEMESQMLETQFPTLSGRAFATARNMVVAAGLSVLQAEGQFIYRVFADGKKEVVKKIEPPIDVAIGTKFVIS
jgi:hypothetical protein